MTTDELFKKLKKHGFDIRKENELACNIYYIFYKELYCVQLFPNLEFEGTFVMTSGFKDLKRGRKEALYKALTEYAATPIEERTPKRYFRYRLKPISNIVDSLLYYLKYDAHFCVFVLESIDVCNDFEVIFEEDDPLLKDVNLKLFVAEEVDQEGNELHD